MVSVLHLNHAWCEQAPGPPPRGPANIVSTLIGIALRPEEHYPVERLSEIARAIGLVGAPSAGARGHQFL